MPCLQVPCEPPPALRSFLSRILVLALLFSSELIVISVFLDGESLARTSGLTGFVRTWGAWTLRAVVGFTALFATFAFLKNRYTLQFVSTRLAQTSPAWRLLAAHAASLAIFAAASAGLYGSPVSGLPADALAAIWLAAGITAIACAAFAFLPWSVWTELVRGTGSLWAYALLAVVAGCVAGNLGRLLWQPTTRLTFALSRLLLAPFVPRVVADPARLLLGTSRFSVIVAPECSGLEGAGLILAVGIVWLLLFRRECRFPRALLLIPAGIAVSFLLNAFRLAAIILIGHAGARQIALGGFHSQAGWLMFNAVAVGFCVIVRRVPWFMAAPAARLVVRSSSAENPTAVFLLPFLAILAAGMIATAASGGFEWLYPLRFFAAAAVLWYFRRRYAALDWRCGWSGPALGVLVFLVWIALDRFLLYHPGVPMPAALRQAAPSARLAWIFFRVLAATTIVPLAEELAFRGFLLRRLVASDFESVRFQSVTWLALCLSSAAFGLLHGQRWVAGTIAGLLFAMPLKHRGRIGDAVVAHATANALLAVSVLVFGAWQFW